MGIDTSTYLVDDGDQVDLDVEGGYRHQVDGLGENGDNPLGIGTSLDNEGEYEEDDEGEYEEVDEGEYEQVDKGESEQVNLDDLPQFKPGGIYERRANSDQVGVDRILGIDDDNDRHVSYDDDTLGYAEKGQHIAAKMAGHGITGEVLPPKVWDRDENTLTSGETYDRVAPPPPTADGWPTANTLTSGETYDRVAPPPPTADGLQPTKPMLNRDVQDDSVRVPTGRDLVHNAQNQDICHFDKNI